MVKRNKILLIFGLLLLFGIIALGTYNWYLYFLKESSKFVADSNNKIVAGDIVLDDNGNGLNIKDATNIDDEDVNSVIPYTFTIKNNSSKNSNYILYIEDLPLNAINDGCTNLTLLNRSQLKYQLKVDNQIIKEDYLYNIKDNVLDTRNIKGNQVYKYELRIFIFEDAKDWIGKHYHYRVVLNKD